MTISNLSCNEYEFKKASGKHQNVLKNSSTLHVTLSGTTDF